MRGVDQSVGMMFITVAFLLTTWTLVVVAVTVMLPHAFELKTPWPVVVLAWVAPILPYLSKRLRC